MLWEHNNLRASGQFVVSGLLSPARALPLRAPIGLGVACQLGREGMETAVEEVLAGLGRGLGADGVQERGGFGAGKVGTRVASLPIRRFHYAT